MMETNRWQRIGTHWLYPRWRVARYFPPLHLQALSHEIQLSEAKHTGQIRFVIESSMNFSLLWHRISPRQRAWQWFSNLGVWNTEHNCGVLVYISFADHQIEIVADRGISACVGNDNWQVVCNEILNQFQQYQFMEGLHLGLQQITDILTHHFPSHAPSPDELSNDVLLV